MEQQLLGYEHEIYRLDHAEHIVGRLDRVAPQILRTRQNLMTRPPEQIRPYLRRVEFESIAYMVVFEHDWSLASALKERWRLESHTFYLPCGEMTITLQDVAYQLGLRIDSDPDRQSQTKWTVKLTWFHNTVCGELEQDVTKERLMRYTRGYIIQLIGGILFPDASDSRVHIRWLLLLEDIDACGRLSWGSAVLAWWVQYRPDNATGESRLRQYRRMLNGIGMLNVEWTPYADPQLVGIVPSAIAEVDASAAVVCPLLCFAIVEWHQVDRVVRQFGGL
ncbi:serine/threonine-protein phosphatase 7 long form homolog [Arachis stenosperma]|uniref:serine/threonine-protein phosphatase 7 long form homolog n=1 Tax=Arachis stenosperma TaxID=217475 RepID=UPI0025AC94A3|nr:serine/threonine-protein phosphatase 7 long form homolog [Arachis stenosperma]